MRERKRKTRGFATNYGTAGPLGLETEGSPDEALVIKISEGDFPYILHET